MPESDSVLATVHDALINGLALIGDDVQIQPFEPGRQVGAPNALNYEDLQVDWYTSVDSLFATDASTRAAVLKMLSFINPQLVRMMVEPNQCRFLYLDLNENRPLPELYIPLKYKGFPFAIWAYQKHVLKDVVRLSIGTTVPERYLDL